MTYQIRRLLEFFRAERARVPPYVSYAVLLYGKVLPANVNRRLLQQTDFLEPRSNPTRILMFDFQTKRRLTLFVAAVFCRAGPYLIVPPAALSSKVTYVVRESTFFGSVVSATGENQTLILSHSESDNI